MCSVEEQVDFIKNTPELIDGEARMALNMISVSITIAQSKAETDVRALLKYSTHGDFMHMPERAESQQWKATANVV